MFRLNRSASDERGNVIISVLVSMAATIAVVGAMTSVVNGLDSARTDQDRSNAFQYANAGIDQALYRIDAQQLPTVASGTYAPTLDAAGQVTGFTETIMVGEASYQVIVTQSPVGQDTTWKVRSIGTEPNGRQRQAIATISATRLFENAFFTVKEFTLTGNQRLETSPVSYKSSECPSASTVCELDPPAAGRLGTNGVFSGSSATVDALRTQWSGFAMYGRSTQEAADEACFEGGCGTAPTVIAVTEQLRIDEQLDAIEEMRPADAASCPNGGVIANRTIDPGDYVCGDLNLSGVVNVSGTGNVRFWVSGAVNAAASTVLNRAQRPQRVQIFQTGDIPEVSGPAGGTICDSELWTLLYAPRLVINCNGAHQPEIFGAVVANLENGAGNHFAFHWDMESADAVNDGRYHVRDWRECPVSADDC